MSLEMESKRCMNTSCPTSKSTQWRKGWTLRSGASALLCDTCGLAYEEGKFCDLFHKKPDGWRTCSLCGKRLHCGCIVSQPLIVLRGFGGIFCITCSKTSGQIPQPPIIGKKSEPIIGKKSELIKRKNDQEVVSTGRKTR